MRLAHRQTGPTKYRQARTTNDSNQKLYNSWGTPGDSGGFRGQGFRGQAHNQDSGDKDSGDKDSGDRPIIRSSNSEDSGDRTPRIPGTGP